MGKCVICKTANKKDCGKTFHKFPRRDSNLFQKWVDNITEGIPGGGYKLGKDSLLCSEHFEESCFDRTGFRVHLNKNSIPTIFSEAHFSPRKKKKSTRIKNSSDHSNESGHVKSRGKTTALHEVDNDASLRSRRIGTAKRRSKPRIIDDVILGRCELNTAKVNGVLKIIRTTETCDTTVDRNVGDNNISVTPEAENSHRVDFINCDHDYERRVTSTSNWKEEDDDASGISPSERHIRLIAHDHHYFDSTDTLRTKLAATRKALVDKKKLVQSQQKRLKRMRLKIAALELAFHSNFDMNHQLASESTVS